MRVYSQCVQGLIHTYLHLIRFRILFSLFFIESSNCSSIHFQQKRVLWIVWLWSVFQCNCVIFVVEFNLYVSFNCCSILAAGMIAYGGQQYEQVLPNYYIHQNGQRWKNMKKCTHQNVIADHIQWRILDNYDAKCKMALCLVSKNITNHQFELSLFTIKSLIINKAFKLKQFIYLIGFILWPWLLLLHIWGLIPSPLFALIFKLHASSSSFEYIPLLMGRYIISFVCD